MPTSYHMVHYRRFAPQKGGSPLEVLCRVALSNTDASGLTLWQRVGDRFCDLPDSSNRKALLNKVADLSTAVFGEMCLVQSDGLQAILQLTASSVQLSNITTAQVFNLQERSAPQNSQFIRGMIYWLAIGNHLFFVKTQSMTAEHLRQYLDWLLRSRTNTLTQSVAVSLQAEFDKAQLGGDIGDVQRFRVSGNAVSVAFQTAAQAPDSSKTISTTVRKTARRIADRLVEFEQAVPIVTALLGPAKAKSLVDSLGPNEYLAVDASVKVQGRRTEESKVRMQALANELADLTDGKVLVEGKDGALSDDDAILRTRMPFNLAHEGGNFLEFDNVADQLQEVYSRFVKDGKIKA